MAVLLLLALNPVLATYSSMVMAEVPFLVVFLLALLAVERWQAESRTVTGAGAATVLLLPYLVWVKQAGIGLAVGAVLYLLWRRETRKALVAAGGLILLLCRWPWPGTRLRSRCWARATPPRSTGVATVWCIG